MYGIYIIHEKKKAGLASDVDKRLAKQGYTRDDDGVEIFVEGISDLALARQIEKDVQKSLGYTDCEQGEDLVDKFLKRKGLKNDSPLKEAEAQGIYKTLKGNTIGFRIESENIMDLIGNGCTFETNKGTYIASADDIEALNKAGHFNASKFDGELKTYIYTKIVDNYFNNKKDEPICDGRVDRLLADIHSWADDRGILKGKIETQTLKLGEEFGELQKAVLKSNSLEIKDAIGDIIVVLVSIAYFNGHSVADALQMAYDTISKRTGYTNEKGDFIKTGTI